MEIIQSPLSVWHLKLSVTSPQQLFLPLVTVFFKLIEILRTYHISDTLKAYNSLFLEYILSRTAITAFNFRNFLTIPQRKALFFSTSLLSSLAALGNHRSTICLYSFACSGHFTEMRPHPMSSFVTDSLRVALLFSRFIHAAACHSFSWLNNIPACA